MGYLCLWDIFYYSFLLKKIAIGYNVSLVFFFGCLFLCYQQMFNPATQTAARKCRRKSIYLLRLINTRIELLAPAICIGNMENLQFTRLWFSPTWADPAWQAFGGILHWPSNGRFLKNCPIIQNASKLQVEDITKFR